MNWATALDARTRASSDEISMTAAQIIGAAYEDAACDFLRHQGLALLARNHRARGGEIDLIMRDGETLAFIEVRYRRSAAYGGALASVDARKRQRLAAAARHYLSYHPEEERPCRFDVLAHEGTGGWRWIKSAFDVGDD